MGKEASGTEIEGTLGGKAHIYLCGGCRQAEAFLYIPNTHQPEPHQPHFMPSPPPTLGRSGSQQAGSDAQTPTKAFFTREPFLPGGQILSVEFSKNSLVCPTSQEEIPTCLHLTQRWGVVGACRILETSWWSSAPQKNQKQKYDTAVVEFSEVPVTLTS